MIDHGNRKTKPEQDKRRDVSIPAVRKKALPEGYGKTKEQHKQ